MLVINEKYLCTGGVIHMVLPSLHSVPRNNFQTNGTNFTDVYLAKYDTDFNLKWAFALGEGWNSTSTGRRPQIDTYSTCQL